MKASEFDEKFDEAERDDQEAFHAYIDKLQES